MDDAKQSLHLEKLVNYAKSNNQKLNADAFRKFNSGRAFLHELADKYEGMKKMDFLTIKGMMEDTKQIRKKIKEYRDKSLAHEDLKKKKVIISRKEIMKIFDLIRTVLNIFSNRTDFSTTSYAFAKNACSSDTKNIINNLKRRKNKTAPCEPREAGRAGTERMSSEARLQ